MRGHWASPNYRRDHDAIRDMKRNENAEQGVPGYGPQAVAMQRVSLATKVYSTAVGRRLNPDVQRPGKYEFLR